MWSVSGKHQEAGEEEEGGEGGVVPSSHFLEEAHLGGREMRKRQSNSCSYE